MEILTQFPRTAALVGLSSSLYGLIFFQADAGLISSLFGSVVVLFAAYLVHRREMRKLRAEMEQARQEEQHETTDSLLRRTEDREKRLDAKETHLRQEERAFFDRQLELSRRRTHLLTDGYMAMELANDRLIELLREKQIEIPPEALTYNTRRLLLTELKIVKDEQERDLIASRMIEE